MKKCDHCFLKHSDEMAFNCIGDLSPKECIGRLQGAIEMLTDEQHVIPQCLPAATRLDYEVEGHGTIWIPKGATTEEVAIAILDDCDTYEFNLEYTM